uniref:Uncharacterized protein n=1 Tax=Anopheles darlingi TaxID=43151 RepID=A0A2M4CJR6_ANODA
MQQHGQTHQQQPGLPTQQQLTSQTVPQTQNGQQPNSNRNVLSSNQIGNQIIVACGGLGSGGCGSGNAVSAVIGAVGNCVSSVRPSCTQGPGSSASQRYPSPIQRPCNYSQGSVQGIQQHHLQRSNRPVAGHQQSSGTQSTIVPTIGQGISNTNKNYYTGNRS